MLARLVLIAVIGGVAIVAALRYEAPLPEAQHASSAWPVFANGFSTAGTLEEAGYIDESESGYWWLDSGGLMHMSGGVAETAQGALLSGNAWREEYAHSNPRDTNEGYYPQNIFRLLQRGSWNNVRTQAFFRIIRDNESESPEYGESNGLLLMSRYRNDDTLYYAGIRVDGNAVIKKKLNGEYHTLAQEEIFPGPYMTGKNLLPHGAWIGLRSETETLESGVRIRLYVLAPGERDWHLALETVDTGEEDAAITGSGKIGIRTDFMDVQFAGFRAEEL